MLDRTNSLSSTLLSFFSPEDVTGPPAPDETATEETPLDLGPPAEETNTLLPDWANQFLNQYLPGQIDSELLQNEFSKKGAGASKETTRTEETQGVATNTKSYRSEQKARQAVADKAIEYAGTGAHNEPEKYLDLLAGPDDIKGRKGMLSNSSCALFARGVLRESGVDSKYLKTFKSWSINLNKPEGPKAFNAIIDVKRAAQEKDAWVDHPKFDKNTVKPSQFPKMGDMVAIRDSKNKKEHMIVLTSDFRPDLKHPGDFLVNTVEGGQGDFTKSNDHSDAFGTSPGVARKRPEGKGDNEPRRMRVGKDGKIWTILANGEPSRNIFGYANVGKMLGPSSG